MAQDGLGLTIAHLYPRQMNIYGDRGNVICLARRCAARGLEARIVDVGPGEAVKAGDWDILFIGGGQDREQRFVAEDLRHQKGEAIKQAIEDGLVALAICGGYQLFGHFYLPAQGPELPGIGVFDVWTIHGGDNSRRCIGNLVARWDGDTLVGFENHGGLTYLVPGAKPLAQVVAGYGNNGEDGTEGAVNKNAFGTYLHGAFLPKNPHFADHLIALALGRRYGPVPIPALDDVVERQAHLAALRLTLGRDWRRALGPQVARGEPSLASAPGGLSKPGLKEISW